MDSPQLDQMDSSLAADEKKHMSASDQAMEEIMESEGVSETDETLPVKTAAAPAKPKMATSSVEVHDAIVQLKAFCINTFGKAKNIDEGHDSKRTIGSSIVPFLIAFGKDSGMSTKKKTGGVIGEYAELFGKYEKKYPTGIGKYMLDKLNSAILEGRNILLYEKKDGKEQYTISYEMLGFETQPEYMTSLDSSIGQMMHTKVSVSEANQSADTQAAVAIVTEKHNTAFKAFYAAELKKVEASKKAQELQVAAASYAASQSAYKNAYAKDSKTKLLHVAVQSAEAIAAAEKAEKTSGVTIPSTESLKAAAETEAKKVDAIAEESVSTTAQTVRVLEAKAESGDGR